MNQNLITLQDYKSYQGTTKSDQDFKLNMLIGACSNLIKGYTMRNFIDNYETPLVEVIELDYQTNVIFPSQLPIRDVISITELAQLTFSSSVHFPLQFEIDYTIGQDRITRVSKDLPYWYAGPAGIVLTYRAGYPAVPDDVKYCCILLVEYYLNERYIQSKTIGGTSINNYNVKQVESAKMPAHIARILDYYKEYL